jgi:hypothetical protein
MITDVNYFGIGSSILIMIEGQFQAFKRLSSSKLVLKPLKAVSWPSIKMRMAVVLNIKVCIVILALYIKV